MINKLFLFCSILFCSFLLEAQVSARVVLLKDGDTYVLRINKRNITVRLNNVDAPEMSQAWGIKSKVRVTNLIYRKEVLFDSTGKDIYGRILGNITLNGKRLDLILIENGWAWHYINYSDDPLLANAMKDASENRKGLWYCGKENVCPPWLYRSYDKRYKAKFCRGCK